MLGSRTIAIHLVRGAIGALAVYVVWLWSETSWWVAGPALLVALFAFGGCPMCWVVGLIDTGLNGRRNEGSGCGGGQCPPAG